MVAAAVAAGVAVAATAASTALSATQGGPNTPTLGGASGLEARTRNRQRDILFRAENFANRGAFESNLIAPSLYEFAGYEVERDPSTIAAATQQRQEADAATERFNEARVTLDKLTGPSRKKAVKELKAQGLKGKALRKAKKELKKQTKTARLELRESRRAVETEGREAADAETAANRITGLKKGELGSAEDQEIDRLLTGRVTKALQTGESDDPRLNRELAEEEGLIRARLSRQFGPDYENTTAGQIALNNFRQRRTESLADFARRDVSEYNPMRLNQRTTLGQIAGQRLGLAQAATGERWRTSENLQNLSTSYQRFNEMLQQDRLAQFQSKVAKSQADYAADQARMGAITSGLGQLASAAGGVAGAYGTGSFGGGAGAVAQPTTVNVPRY